MNEKWLFLRQFLQYGRRISSCFPSSKALAQSACRYIDPNVPQTILELGAGTGAVTEVALQKMHPQSRLISIESNLEFVEYLRKRCPKAMVIATDAQNMLQQLHERGIDKVDVIMNILPTSSLSEEINKQIQKSCQALMADTQTPIAQLSLVPWFHFKFYQSLFKEVEFKFVLNSFPPGGCYYCRGWRFPN